MAIIDESYFIGEITVAQRSQESVLEDLNFKIDKYERDFLHRFFGVKMTKDFLQGIEDEDPKWLKLLNGDYFDDGNRYWMGFANDEKQSIIANYVYWFYTRDLFMQETGSGSAIPQNENSTHANPTYKQIRAWNEMVDWIMTLHDYLYANDFSDYRWMSLHWGCGCKPEFPFVKKNSLGL